MCRTHRPEKKTPSSVVPIGHRVSASTNAHRRSSEDAGRHGAPSMHEPASFPTSHTTRGVLCPSGSGARGVVVRRLRARPKVPFAVVHVPTTAAVPRGSIIGAHGVVVHVDDRAARAKLRRAAAGTAGVPVDRGRSRRASGGGNDRVAHGARNGRDSSGGRHSCRCRRSRRDRRRRRPRRWYSPPRSPHPGRLDRRSHRPPPRSPRSLPGCCRPAPSRPPPSRPPR